VHIGRRDILLGFIAIPRGKTFLSSVQIMLGLFLLKEKVGLEGFYDFRPYLYGPCSFEVYSDLDRLVRENLVLRIPSYGFSLYGISSKGRSYFESISEGIDQDLLDAMGEIKEDISGEPVLMTLKKLCIKYPNFFVNSIFSCGGLVSL